IPPGCLHGCHLLRTRSTATRGESVGTARRALRLDRRARAFVSGSPPGLSKETGRRRLRPDAVGEVRPNTAYSNRVLSVFGASGKRCGDYEPEPAEWWMALGRDGTLLTMTQDTDCTFRWYPQLFK